MQIEDPNEGTTIIDVIWYFAPPGAKRYPHEHAFGSGIWDYNKIELPHQLGEQPPYDTPWYNGRNVWGYLGECSIGTPEQFLNGVSAAELAAPPPPMPLCCGGSLPIRGGLGIGCTISQPVQLLDCSADLYPLIPPLVATAPIGINLGLGGTVKSAFAGPAPIGLKLGLGGNVRSAFAGPAPIGLKLGLGGNVRSAFAGVAPIGLKLGFGGKPTNPLQAGCTAFWPCHEVSGPRLDATGNGHTMTPTPGGVGSMAGLIGLAADCSSGNWLQSSFVPYVSGPFTISIWFANGYGGSLNYLWSQDGLAAGEVQWSFGGYGCYLGGLLVGYTDALAPLSWHHVLVRFDGSELNLYADGILAAQTFAPASPSGSTMSGLGTWPTFSYPSHGAVLQLVGTWNRALTDGFATLGNPAGGEVAQLYNGGAGLDWPL